MHTITHENKNVVIMGDFNIDMLKFEMHSKTNSYIDNIFSNAYIPLITKPTRLTPHSATLIDHIYTNDISRSYKSGIIITDIADHFGIFTIIKNIIDKPKPKLLPSDHIKNTICIFLEIYYRNVPYYLTPLQHTNIQI